VEIKAQVTGEVEFVQLFDGIPRIVIKACKGCMPGI
jgi:hypothetical protein